jgi:hypothetical protein
MRATTSISLSAVESPSYSSEESLSMSSDARLTWATCSPHAFAWTTTRTSSTRTTPPLRGRRMLVRSQSSAPNVDAYTPTTSWTVMRLDSRKAKKAGKTWRLCSSGPRAAYFTVKSAPFPARILMEITLQSQVVVVNYSTSSTKTPCCKARTDNIQYFHRNADILVTSAMEYPRFYSNI